MMVNMKILFTSDLHCQFSIILTPSARNVFQNDFTPIGTEYVKVNSLHPYIVYSLWIWICSFFIKNDKMLVVVKNSGYFDKQI